MMTILLQFDGLTPLVNLQHMPEATYLGTAVMEQLLKGVIFRYFDLEDDDEGHQ